MVPSDWQFIELIVGIRKDGSFDSHCDLHNDKTVNRKDNLFMGVNIVKGGEKGKKDNRLDQGGNKCCCVLRCHFATVPANLW